ncbi:MAG: PIN domain-containing protein, partial [Deltaproteobacteria bacterium]|nr:PIN domain-containing protein [Deltaproteobacteria bacterium]
MRILDSSVLVAFYRENEQNHMKAVDLIQSSEDFVVPDHVLAEVATVLKMREGFMVAKKALEFLTSTDGIKIYETQPELFWSSMSF